MTDRDPLPPLAPQAPLVVVISGPSGVGKTAICDRLVERDSHFRHSVSATTRPRRDHETESEDYFFYDEAHFRRDDEAGMFLESAVVYGHLYGTPKTFVEETLERGLGVVANVDIQGGKSVKRLLPDSVLIFVSPPSLEELEKRLRGRKSDSEEVVQNRLAKATEELAEWPHYDYVVENLDLERAVDEVQAIVTAERARVERLRGG